jgi:DNA-binding NarL/FixJ family response regulator
LLPVSAHACHVARTALIVDDSPAFREAATALLAERGFDMLITATDASEALAAAAEMRPCGILLDIVLPSQDGFTVAAQLAAVCPEARIVLTSASVTYVPEEMLRECAAIAFVRKEELADVDLAGLFTPEGT